MNNTQKNLLMNLYFLKQLIRAKEYDKAIMMLENEVGIDREELIENPTNKTLEEAVSNFTIALAQVQNNDLQQMSEEYITFFKSLYYAVIDLKNDFIETNDIIDNLSILFEFPMFEATLLHYVQNEMIKERESFNNVVLSTYIHISHVKFLSLIDDIEAVNEYIYEIGLDFDSSLELDLERHEVELIKKLELESNDFDTQIINYFNSLSNEIQSNNLPSVISSCEYVLSQLKQNIYIKNIL